MISSLAGAGYPILALAVLIGAVGAPLPLSAVLAAAAALARQGHLRLSALFFICVGAALLGDCLGYAIGRHGLARLPLARLARLSGRRSWQRWSLGSGIYGGMAALIFLTRWAVTAPAPVVNVVAGARRYPWHRFLVIDLSGEILWVALSLTPGYLLGGIGPVGIAIASGACLVPLVLGMAARSRLAPGIPA